MAYQAMGEAIRMAMATQAINWRDNRNRISEILAPNRRQLLLQIRGYHADVIWQTGKEMKAASITSGTEPVLSRLAHDRRLTKIHISLYAALVYYSTNENPFQVSRSKLMGFSRIRSTATYHKYIRQLVGYGYIRYEPSYHPKYGSRICLIVPNEGCLQGKCEG